jgi:large subunit ribosomal protein L9
MKIVLKEDVKNLGKKHEVKEVSDGYANNYLIPNKLAEYATVNAVKKAEMLKSAHDTEQEIKEKLLEKQLELLSGVKVVIKKKANEKGHLFEKIHEVEITEALKKEANIEIPVDMIAILKPIKEIGDHKINVKTDHGEGEFLLTIEAE